MGRYSRDQRQCKLTATKEIEIKYSKKISTLTGLAGYDNMAAILLFL